MKVTTALTILAVTASQAAAAPEADPNFRWNWSSCGFPGAICAKTKRAALAVADALAEPEANPGFRNLWSSCGFPGAICAKTKRTLEELGSTTEETLHNILALDQDVNAAQYHATLSYPTTKSGISKREAEPNFRWLWSSCGFPGSICSKAKRGIELIKEDFPNIHKDECFAEGGECNRVLKARAAFDEAVKAEPEAQQAPWLACGKNGITCARDVYDFAQAKYAGHANTTGYGATCIGPRGECEKADRYFKQLDDALAKATEQVLKGH